MRHLTIVLLGLLCAAPGLAQAQPVSDLDQYLGPDGAAYWALQCRYRGAADACAAITREIEQRWVDSCPERERPIPSGKLQIIRYRLDFEPTNQGRSLAHAVQIWGPCRGDAPTDSEEGSDPNPSPLPGARNGHVRLVGQAFADDDGLFEGFGASLFWALWGERHDPTRIQQNLDWLARRGVNYIRILSMVGAQPYWKDRVINPRWDGYFRTFDDLIRDATQRGLRLNVVLFADAQVMMARQADRLAWVDTMADYLERHRAAVQFVEIANESRFNGIEDVELAALTRRWTARSDILVAPSSPNGDNSPEDAIEALFREQDLSVDLLTPHFERRTDTVEGAYRPHRQPWEVQFYDEVNTSVFVNDEPVGPGSSINSDSDPARNAMGMLNTFLSRGAGFVFHSNAGVRGQRGAGGPPFNLWEVEHAETIMTALRGIIALVPGGIANGATCNHHWSCHPYATDDQIWPDTGRDGVVRAIASEVDGVFYVGVMGMRGSYEVQAKWPMVIEVFDARTVDRLEVVTLAAGQHHTFHVTADGGENFIHRITRR